MLNEKNIKHGIKYAQSLSNEYEEDHPLKNFLKGMISAYEIVLEK